MKTFLQATEDVNDDMGETPDLDVSVGRLLDHFTADVIIEAVRVFRDQRKADAKKDLDTKRAALDAEYAKAGLPIRTLGPRTKKALSVTPEQRQKQSDKAAEFGI